MHAEPSPAAIAGAADADAGPVDAATLERFAELIVNFAANVQRGQIVAIGTEPGKLALTRAVAAAAYRAGAKYVDVTVFDLHVKRARILHADEDTLDYVPPWLGERVLALGEHRAARIGLTGPVAPGLLSDLDPQRAGRDQLPFLRENAEVVNARTTNWTAAPCPTQAWAELVYPQLSPAEAYARLWQEVLYMCRLDEPDPVAAWRARQDTLVGVSERLSELRFDALHFEGPGTDLTVGLLPTSRWLCARFSTLDGIEHMPNIPSEETFTTPDPRRVDGHVTSTKPLVLPDGGVVRDLRVRFEGGVAVEVDASTGADTMRTIVARDPGAARLGELALVDGEGRIGALDTVFYDTLLDENAASHIAIGAGFEWCIEDEADHPNVNDSAHHIDFMIGSPEVSATGLTADGERVPVLVAGEWRI